MKSLAWGAAGAAVGAVMLAACAGTHAEGGTTSSGAGGGDGAGGASTSTSGTTASGATTTGKTSSTGATTAATTSTGTGTSTSSGGSSDVTVIVTPDTGAVAQIVSAIAAATASVHMTMYILDNTSIVDALVAQKEAGRDVRVVLNQTFPSGTVQSNPATYTKLTQAGIGVVWRNGPPSAASGAYTHEKTFIVDGKVAWIMTMNLDASAGQYNREYLVVDNVAADVAEADAIFLADFAGTVTTDTSPLVVSPTNSRADVVALINSATKTLDVEVEEFSDNYNGVTAAVAAAAHRGVATRVILAQGSTDSAQTTAVATVKAAGAKVVVSGGTSGGSTASNPYIHAKAVTVDCTGTTCARGFLGSENFSGGSLGYNRELGVLIDNPTQLALVETAIDHDFSVGTAQ